MENRKTFLHILLVISMLWSGMSALSYGLLCSMLPSIREVWQQYESQFPSEVSIMMEQLLDAPRAYYLGMTLLALLELLGCIYMWRLRWPGFHCYTLARFLLLLLPILFLGRGYLGVGDIMMALLYIAVYFLLLRRLNVQSEQDPNS